MNPFPYGEPTGRRNADDMGNPPVKPLTGPPPIPRCQCKQMGTDAPCGWCDGPDREVRAVKVPSVR